MNSLAIAIPVTAALALGILLKRDKQIVNLLESKLQRQGRDWSIAREVYRKHTTRSSLVFWVCGVTLLVVGLIWASIWPAAGWITGSVGATLALWGAIARIQGFRTADRELDTAL